MSPTWLLQLCELRVHETVAQDDLAQHGLTRAALVDRIADIVSRNLHSGRVKRAMAWAERQPATDDEPLIPSTDPQPSIAHPSVADPHIERYIERYIERVIATYLAEHDRVDRLAADDEPAWSELRDHLTRRAYRILLRRQVPAARAADEARDFAQQVCDAIFNRPFPCDVPFDAWTGRILINRILQRDTRSRDLIDRLPAILSLDQPIHGSPGDEFSLHQLLADPSANSAFERIEVQEWLLQAIGRLPSQEQQQVIIDTYFYELSSGEIAQRLGISKAAVYSLRHRALRQLKLILDP